MSGVRIGIVAGEVSGDILGAGLMKALKQKLPEANFVGIGGPLMLEQGCTSLIPMHRLSVMGFVEILGRLFEILKIRKTVIEYFIEQPPDIFIGIDAPDFNLVLEKKLRAAGITTVHYVSPTVWAWRGYRIKKIHEAVDHMLTLFPFEAEYYRKQNIPVTFVGHPMADKIENLNKEDCRDDLGLKSNLKMVALLPGSRTSELKHHSDLFIKTVQWLHKRHPEYVFVLPFVNTESREIFEQALQVNGGNELPIEKIDGKSHEVLAAADVALVASGTAALEAALLERAMVITYKVSFVTARMVRLFSHVELYSMPNNLAGKELCPEFIRYQSLATPENLGEAVEQLMENTEARQNIEKELGEIHKNLKRNAHQRASKVITDMLRQSGLISKIV